MNKTTIYVYGGLSLALLATSAAISNPRTSHASASRAIKQTPGAAASDVVVTNTTAQAIPTVAQGTTLVGGNVKASQIGAWNVGITGTPAVTLSGTPAVALAANSSVKIVNVATSAVPVFVINEGNRQPFQQTVLMTQGSDGNAHATITVPTGWRLAIEHVNGYAFINKVDDIENYQVATMYNGTYASYFFRPLPSGDADHYHTYINEPLVAYADSGSSVILLIERLQGGTGAPAATGFMTLSGYLEK